MTGEVKRDQGLSVLLLSPGANPNRCPKGNQSAPPLQDLEFDIDLFCQHDPRGSRNRSASVSAGINEITWVAL